MELRDGEVHIEAKPRPKWTKLSEADGGVMTGCAVFLQGSCTCSNWRGPPRLACSFQQPAHSSQLDMIWMQKNDPSFQCRLFFLPFDASPHRGLQHPSTMMHWRELVYIAPPINMTKGEGKEASRAVCRVRYGVIAV